MSALPKRPSCGRHIELLALVFSLVAGGCGALEASSGRDQDPAARSLNTAGEPLTSCAAPLRYPWDDGGITAAWHTQDGSVLTLVSRDKLWNLRWSDSAWIFAGKVKEVAPFTTAPLVNGRHPWDGPGITAAWHNPDNTILTIVSGDRWWNLQWIGNVWHSQGMLKNLPPFPQAPRVNGSLPWESGGLTAAWHTQDGSLLTVVSEDRLWNMRWSDFAWITALPVAQVTPLSVADRCCVSDLSLIRHDNMTIAGGAGITAAWHTPDNSILTLVNENRLWNMRWNPSASQRAFTEDTPLFLTSVTPFPSAPGVAQ